LRDLALSIDVQQATGMLYRINSVRARVGMTAIRARQNKRNTVSVIGKMLGDKNNYALKYCTVYTVLTYW
jgi:hypothetical protein